MDTKTQTTSNRSYEDFEPASQWERDERTATLIVQLPGFIREQLKVQLTSTPLIMIVGERPISGNKWHRVNKEFPIPSDCNTNEVTARFEHGHLYVKFPIVIIRKAPKPQEIAKPPQEGPKPQEAPPKSRKDKAEEAKGYEVSEEKERPQKEKESPKKKDKREEKKKVRTSEVVESIAEATTSKDVGENLGAQGLIKRTKTRVLDYTISLTPTYEGCKDALGELKKPNKLVNSILAILFVVALGIYIRNAFRSIFGGSKLQD